MKNYANTNIRNILVAGHAGCGKTTLVEALLYTTGALERMGRVEDGNTVSDFDPEEAKRRASLNLAVVPVEYEDVKLNFPKDIHGMLTAFYGDYMTLPPVEKRKTHYPYILDFGDGKNVAG